MANTTPDIVTVGFADAWLVDATVIGGAIVLVVRWLTHGVWFPRALVHGS